MDLAATSAATTPMIVLHQPVHQPSIAKVAPTGTTTDIPTQATLSPTTPLNGRTVTATDAVTTSPATTRTSSLMRAASGPTRTVMAMVTTQVA